MQDMATIHITRAEAVRNIDALLEQASAGAEIVIESESAPPLVLRVDEAETDEESHAVWVRGLVQEALDDTRPGISHDAMKERLEKKAVAFFGDTPEARS